MFSHSHTPQDRVRVPHDRPRRGLALVALVVVLALAAPVALAAPGNGPIEEGDYLVGFHDRVPDKGNRLHGAHVALSQGAAGFAVIAAQDARGFQERAARDPNIRYIERDDPHAVSPFSAPNDPRYSDQWGLAPLPGLDMVRAWGLGQGSRDIIVAVLDSGIDPKHPDLDPLPGRDIINGDNIPEDDCNGHGTHVAGTVGALTNNGVGVAGVADTSILPVKVMRAQSTGGCSGSWSAVANGIVWATDQGAHVITMSLGARNGYSSAVADALRYAALHDVVVIAAAGNDGCSGTGCVSYPASDPTVIAVSATSSDGRIASFSSTGPEVELAAPGRFILSTMPGGGYAYKSGTSMAAPHVAGVAALVRAAAPLSAPEVRDHLKATAHDLGLTVHQQGAGTVHAYAALDALQAPNQSPIASMQVQCEALRCHLDASGSRDPDGEIVSYEWVLGDGTTSTGKQIDHTYPSSGNYEVTLRVTDDVGATDDQRRSIQVEAPPKAPLTATFDVSPNINEWWIEVRIDASHPISTVRVQIDGGNWIALSHTNWGSWARSTYTPEGAQVQFRVIDTDGDRVFSETYTWMQRATPEPEPEPPVAAMNIDCDGLACTFDATASTSPSGSIVSYDWTFGDGTSATGSKVTHRYAAAGAYEVILSVSDTNGMENQVHEHIDVVRPFTASFTVSPNINQWWVEVWVEGSAPVTRVHVQIDGGNWIALPRTDWGTWARSTHTPAGSEVVFRATDAEGQRAFSETYVWMRS